MWIEKREGWQRLLGYKVMINHQRINASRAKFSQTLVIGRTTVTRDNQIGSLSQDALQSMRGHSVPTVEPASQERTRDAAESLNDVAQDCGSCHPIAVVVAKNDYVLSFLDRLR